MLKRYFLLCAAALLFAPTVLAADAPPKMPERVKATVQQLDGGTLHVMTIDGRSLAVTLPDSLQVTRRKKASLAEVKTGQFIGCTAVEGPDGKLVAEEIHILPESMRGVGEGHYPWGDRPDTTMTNGNIKDFEGVAAGKAIKVEYKGGESEIQIPPDVSVTLIEPVGRDALKPGVKVGLYLAEDAGTGPVARFVSVEAAEGTQ